MAGKKPWDARRLLLQELLQEMRAGAGLKQVELAERISSDQSFVSRFERGERRLDLVELQEICAACGMSLDAFVRRFSARIEAKKGRSRR